MLGMNKAVDTIKKNNTIIEGLQKVLNKDKFNLASLFFRKCRTMYEIRKKNQEVRLKQIQDHPKAVLLFIEYPSERLKNRDSKILGA